jgi:hypothetical protein
MWKEKKMVWLRTWDKQEDLNQEEDTNEWKTTWEEGMEGVGD